MVQDDDLAADRLYVFDNMGGQKYKAFLRRMGEQVPEAEPLLRVKPHRGLIENQERRVFQQCLCDADALALAA